MTTDSSPPAGRPPLQMPCGYAGDVAPQQAWQWMRLGDAVLVDVRTDAEREWVGFVPGAVAVAWKQWPGMAENAGFDEALKAAVAGCGQWRRRAGPRNWDWRPTTFWRALKAMLTSRPSAGTWGAGACRACPGCKNNVISMR